MARRVFGERISRKGTWHREKSFLEIVEEAVHLVRTAPLKTLALYYIGSGPFVLGLLYFWTDMMQSAFAYQHSAEAALGLTGLFLWMKSWQSLFTYQLLGYIRGEPDVNLGKRRILQLSVMQTILQPWGMLLLPITLLMVFPFPWMYAFYQNATVLGNGEDDSVITVCRRSWEQAKLWPKQNILCIWLLSPWLLMIAAVVALVFIPVISTGNPDSFSIIILYLFFAILLLLSPLGVIIAANIALALVWIPHLLKTFLGIETVFTLSSFSFLHSTFFAVICGMTYLGLDPLLKAGYVLRCFYGESLHSGEDLKAGLTRVMRSGTMIMLILVGLFWCWRPTFLSAATSNEPMISDLSTQTRLSPQELDDSLRQVMTRAEYAWRIPREQSDQDHPENRPSTFLTALGDMLEQVGKTIRRWTSKIRDWLRKISPDPSPQNLNSRRKTGIPWVGVQGLIYSLLAVVACMLGLLLWRVWKKHHYQQSQGVVEELLSIPDVSDEELDATELPEDGWLELAEQFMQEGRLRFALRAFYLAVLSYLAHQGLITISRCKSDRDYQQELKRRAHTMPHMLHAFTENMLVFESVWYGTHKVSLPMIEHFTINRERIKSELHLQHAKK